MFLSAGQTSDSIGARALLSSMSEAKVLLADRGYDADWFRYALSDRCEDQAWSSRDPAVSFRPVYHKPPTRGQLKTC